MRESGDAGRDLHQVGRDSAATACRAPAVFMTSAPDGVPHALLHNLKHNKVLHERVMLLTVQIADVPYVDPDETDSRSTISARASTAW